MKLFKKLRKWFWTKKKTIDYLTEINTILDNKIYESVNTIKELRQDKVYFLNLENYGEYEIMLVDHYLSKIRNRITWTIPEIIIINKKLEEYTKEELKKILKK